MTLQLDTVFVWVSDLDRSLDWYRAIGFEAGSRYGPWQDMAAAGDTRFALHEGERSPGASTCVPSFRVADLAHEIARLGKVGISPSDDQVTDTGVARFITFTDPDGNQIQLLERNS